MNPIRQFWQWLWRRRTCETDGCGSFVPNHWDDKCTVCRLHQGANQ